MYYAIRKSCIENGVLSYYLGGPNPNIPGGSEVIIFDRRGDDVTFIAYTTVELVDVIEEDTYGHYRRLKATLSEPRKLFAPRQLAHYAGSLRKVYRFLKPEKHFMHPAVKLDEKDYLAIYYGFIDFDRTKFRYLFESLPIEIKSDFVRRNVDLFQTDLDNNLTSYSGLPEALEGYFLDIVAPKLRILARLGQLREKMTYTGLIHDDLVLADSSGENPITLSYTLNRINNISKENILIRDPKKMFLMGEECIGSSITEESEAYAVFDSFEEWKEQSWQDSIY